MASEVDDWAERFWSRVRKSDGCWLWTGRVNDKGYGMFDGASSEHGKCSRLAHRLSYLLATGVMPPVLMEVCHRCDVPGCVNPKHLFLGTHRDNMYDSIRKGRFRLQSANTDKKACVAGHDLSLARVDGRGWRQCRECRRLRQIANRAKARAIKTSAIARWDEEEAKR